MRETALEFMVTLSEARPSMVKRTDGWAAALVRGCLEGMGQIPEGEVEIWLESDVSISRCSNDSCADEGP